MFPLLSRVQCILQVTIWCEFLGNSQYFRRILLMGWFFVCLCLSLVTLVGFLLISFCAKFISIASRLPSTIHNKYLYTHRIYCLLSLKNLFPSVHSTGFFVSLQYAVIWEWMACHWYFCIFCSSHFIPLDLFAVLTSLLIHTRLE